jgi:glycerol-3-phosphate dehydrogenase
MSSPPTRFVRDLTPLTSRRHDVLIIGGGITGAGLARDLALRGLTVVLAEQEDFAAGTSSASTKLIHGGVRYLERLNLHLVFEACRERRILQQIAPHLVRPLPLLIPVYRDDPRSLLAIRAGLTLYDALALFRNTHPHRILSVAEGLKREPALRPDGLTGVALYWDCRMDDARLCLENVLAAAEAGALAVNYLRAVALLKRDGRICGARLHDEETGAELEVEARVVVNAAGPWLDQVCALDSAGPAKLRPTRGTHILVPRINRGSEALYLTAGRDDRLFFVIPWDEGLSLVGTTDVDYAGDPGQVVPTEADMEYLLSEAGRHLQQPPPRRDEVVAAFAGLRPLIAADQSQASRVSREHRIFEAASGLLSIGGGKYTTYRSMAAEAAALVCARLGRGQGRSLTARVPLPGGATGDFSAYFRRTLPRLVGQWGLPTATVTRLLNRYGARTPQVLGMLEGEPELARPIIPGSWLLALEVAYSCDCEFARTPGDVLRRRTALALSPGRGLAELPAVAEVMARRIDGAARKDQWLSHYRGRHAAF